MSPLKHLITIMQVKPDGSMRFIANPGHGGKRIYGGLIVAQALDATRRCCPNSFKVQSIHGQFLRPGDYDHSINIEVQVLKDGRRFKLYNVYCRQQDKIIFFATMTFHKPEISFDHTLPATGLELPNASFALYYHQRDERHTSQELNGEPTSIEVRIEDKNNFHSPQTLQARGWYKAAEKLTISEWQNTLLLAYISDWNLPSVAMRPHSVKSTKSLMLASLDHTIWFYGQSNLQDWVIYLQDTPTAKNSRGHTRGLLYSHSGELLACVNQESFLSNYENS